MKKLILFFAVCFSLSMATDSFGQLQKGNILLGTSINLSGSNFNLPNGAPNGAGIFIGKSKSKFGQNEITDDIIMVNLSPQVGYFILDNFVAGITLNIFNYNETDENNDEFTYNAFYGGPFARYYFDLEKANPYIFARAAFGGAKSSYSGSSNDDKTNISNIGAGVGIAIFLNNAVSLDALFGYNFMKIEDEDSTFNSENVNTNFAISIGFTYVLGVNTDSEN